MSILVLDSPPSELAVNGGTITNAGSATVYYRDESVVSSTVNDGSLAPNASVSLNGSQYVVTAKGARSVVVVVGGSTDDGAGLPAGGSTGQVLAKASSADGDAEWVTGGDVPADADASTNGLIRLAGVLNGTASSPGLAADSVGATQLADNAVDAAAIQDGVITTGKLSFNVATQTELDAVESAAATNLSDHVNDTSAAHAATAISFTPNGTIAATTVQAAIQEVRDEAGGGGGSGLPSSVISPSSNYTATAGKFVICDASGGAFTVTLPSNPAAGSLVTVKKSDASLNAITVHPQNSGQIDYIGDYVLAGPNAGAIFQHIDEDYWIAVVDVDDGPVTATLTWNASDEEYQPVALWADTSRPREFIGPASASPFAIDGITFVPETDMWRKTSDTAVLREFGLNPKDFADVTVGNGETTTLTSVYGSLGAAQVRYPFVEDLDVRVDAAAMYATMLAFGDSGGEIMAPRGRYRFGAFQFDLPPILSVKGEGRGRRQDDRAEVDTLATTFDWSDFDSLDDYTAGLFQHNLGETGGVLTLDMEGIDFFMPAEIDVANDYHGMRLQSVEGTFKKCRWTGGGRPINFVNCSHLAFERCSFLKNKVAGVQFNEGCAFITFVNCHWANSFYTPTGGVRAGYVVLGVGSGTTSFLRIADSLFDEQGANGVDLDDCTDIVLQNNLFMCSASQPAGPDTYCLRIRGGADKVKVVDCHSENYWTADADDDAHLIEIESGAQGVILDNFTTTFKGSQTSACVNDDGTGTVERDCVLDGTAPSRSGQ